MILGMSFSTFTTLHLIISLIAIVTGLVALLGMLGGKKLGGWTALFLATTVLTSVTGFLFPFTKLLPSHVVGIISLVVLAAALLALYVFHLDGPLALDLRGGRRPRALPQRLCRCRAGLPEAGIPTAVGADTG